MSKLDIKINVQKKDDIQSQKTMNLQDFKGIAEATKETQVSKSGLFSDKAAKSLFGAPTKAVEKPKEDAKAPPSEPVKADIPKKTLFGAGPTPDKPKQPDVSGQKPATSGSLFGAPKPAPLDDKKAEKPVASGSLFGATTTTPKSNFTFGSGASQAPKP